VQYLERNSMRAGTVNAWLFEFVCILSEGASVQGFKLFSGVLERVIGIIRRLMY
jgi:hypothetical protein